MTDEFVAASARHRERTRARQHEDDNDRDEPPIFTLPHDLITVILAMVQHPDQSIDKAHFIKDLQALALTHRHFLDPVRAMLYREPKLDHDNDRTRARLQGTLQSFIKALRTNPSLALYIHHLPYFGEQIKALNDQQMAPSAVSALAVDVLSKTTNLRTLSIPRVELKDQEKLVQAITCMKGLQQLRLGVGCVRSKDGTPLFHEGDARRIAKACPELEELHVETANVHFAPTSGWVEPFAFKALTTLTLLRATSFGDKHLLAIVSQAKHLTHLNIVDCILPVVDQPDRQHLTRMGVAEVLERCAPRLRSFVLDDSRLNKTPSDDRGDVPCIEQALKKCLVLETLSLAGPGILRPDFLTSLGRPTAVKVSANLSMSLPPTRSAPVALLHLTTLCLHLEPTPFPQLLDFVRALPSTVGPFSVDAIFPELKTLVLIDHTSVANRMFQSDQLPTDQQIDNRLAFIRELGVINASKKARIVITGKHWDSEEYRKEWREGESYRDGVFRKKGFLSGPWIPEVKTLRDESMYLPPRLRNNLNRSARPAPFFPPPPPAPAQVSAAVPLPVTIPPPPTSATVPPTASTDAVTTNFQDDEVQQVAPMAVEQGGDDS